jgi:hypothetical protein
MTHNGHQNFANKQLKASPYQCTELTWYDCPQGLTCNGGNFLLSWVVRRSRGRTPSTHRRA